MKIFSLFTSSTTSNVSFTKTTYKKKLLHIYMIFSLLSSTIFPCFFYSSFSLHYHTVVLVVGFTVCLLLNFSISRSLLVLLNPMQKISQFFICVFFFSFLFFIPKNIKSVEFQMLIGEDVLLQLVDNNTIIIRVFLNKDFKVVLKIYLFFLISRISRRKYLRVLEVIDTQTSFIYLR